MQKPIRRTRSRNASRRSATLIPKSPQRHGRYPVLLKTVAVGAAILISSAAHPKAAVPPPGETPAKIVVSGRTTTAIDVRIVKVGQEVPATFAGNGVTNTPGFTWHVSQHFALKSNMPDAYAAEMLLLAELACPHYAWVMGREPDEIAGQGRSCCTASCRHSHRRDTPRGGPGGPSHGL